MPIRLLACCILLVTTASAQLKFAVSGDSRNCGDVVMPLIAADATKNGAQFYWHLGDLRAMFEFDDDIIRRPNQPRLTITDYEATAWQDFIDNQISPWGKTPFFLGIGNHELIVKTRQEFIVQFADWLNAPVLQQQRLRDDPADHAVKTYFHWIRSGVDFIYLDNASNDQFDSAQMKWLSRVLQQAANNSEVKSIVLGMHAALPDNLDDYSMNGWPQGVDTGRKVYASLLEFKSQMHKPVYLLASHSHFFMANIFNTEALRARNAVLPGWVIGTAGAYRYKLPATANQADKAMTGVYGYMLGTVKPNGEIEFNFREVKQADVPEDEIQKFGPELINYCFNENKQQ
ncbi:MAG: hypothetical protein ACXVZX_12600 [Terriglobales bacterium]